MRHRLAQPEAVHRDEDRPARRAARRRRVGPARRARPGAGPFGAAGERGDVAPKDIWPEFVEKVLSFVDVAAIKPLRVVIDAANGMAGAMLPPVLERLPIDAVSCYFEPDGTFPNHEPNPLLPENREFIVAQDASRRAPISASRSTATPTAASSSTTRASSSPATSSPRCSPSRSREGARRQDDLRRPRQLGRAETIERAGGVALMNRVGHAYIKRACARTMPSSAARSRRTTTSATSRRPTPASCRSC